MTIDKKSNVLIIYNPAAGAESINAFNRVVDALNEKVKNVVVVETEYAGHAREIAYRSIDGDYDLIIAAGGDGTINEVINGLYPSDMPFAIIPLGTVNVLAKEIKLENSHYSILDYILSGKVKPSWLGVSNGHCFFLMMSAGIDARSVAIVNVFLKKYIGRFAYAISFLKCLFKGGNINYKVTVDGKEFYASNVIVSNGKLYGGQYLCAPNMDLEQEKLQVLMAQKKGRWPALKYAYLMLTQQYPDAGSVISISARSVHIISDVDDEPIQLDGDHIGYLPADISVSKSPISLLYPR